MRLVWQRLALLYVQITPSNSRNVSDHWSFNALETLPEYADFVARATH